MHYKCVADPEEAGSVCMNVCNMCRDLEQLEAVPSRQQCMQRSELCRSLAGNSCPLVTITNPSPDPNTQRPAVVFSGTAHALVQAVKHASPFLVTAYCLMHRRWHCH